MRLAADIGGTFTDVVVFDDESGAVTLGKSLSTPDDLARGVRSSIAESHAPLGSASTLIHGSTVVINAIIERNGARTALITTRGFRDVYEIGRINRPDSFNPRFQKHRPLVGREAVYEVDERVLADGTVHIGFDTEGAKSVAVALAEGEFEAVAVLFLHSYRYPAHEIEMARLLTEVLPTAYVSVSHELSREYREYERTSTVVANAYVGPRVSSYLSSLEAGLAADGFSGELLIMQSNGGLSDLHTARRQCVQMTESGPAGGVVGTIALCEALQVEAAVAFDMGGTTAKACVVRRGEPGVSPDYFIGGYESGLALRIPVLDIVEVGTGGGSIAHLDGSGALHVGPRSAGAEPGPACYGRGGSEPTITDANVVLGRLSPASFLGGRLDLDAAAARAALERALATPLGVSLERAAEGILEVATAEMANAVRQVTLQRGLDPRDFTLFAYGGGGPLHAAAVAAELSIDKVVVPTFPGHFSAFGMLLADLRRDYVQTLFARLDGLDMDALEEGFSALEAEGAAALAHSGLAGESVVFERAADMRYVGQEHAVTVKLPSDLGTGEDRRRALKALFDAAHDRRFGHSAGEEPADVVSLRVSAIGRLEKPALPELPSGGTVPPPGARRGGRAVAFPGCGFVPCAVFDRAALLADNEIIGPAVIEESASTTVLPPEGRLVVAPHGHLLITLGATR